MPRDGKPDLLWIDLETTGLNPRRDVILEVAAILTDWNLTELDSDHFTVQPARRRAVRRMVNDVRVMHTRNGLLADAKEGLTLRGAAIRLEQLLWQHGVDVYSRNHKPILAGSSVHFDRAFLARWMPGVERALHHRNFDVSTLHEAAKAWLPEALTPEKWESDHRAMPDIRASLYLAREHRSLYRDYELTRGGY